MELRSDGSPRPGEPRGIKTLRRSIPKVLELPRISQARRLGKQHAASISELCVGTAEKNRRFPIRVIEHLQT